MLVIIDRVRLSGDRLQDSMAFTPKSGLKSQEKEVQNRKSSQNPTRKRSISKGLLPMFCSQRNYFEVR